MGINYIIKDIQELGLIKFYKLRKELKKQGSFICSECINKEMKGGLNKE